ncbi:MAG: NUDIX hydrolase [Bacteroidetes bacterium]|nr:NUDIX hydrolase [Bacteroidota bacterium]MCW5896854.1 NUDIX hydrolase [Bacteroidota bacterium]
MKFCSACGKPVRLAVPEGDHTQRHVCDACNTIHYENPRIIVGCLPVSGNKVLLCKRSNEPRKGFWTLPAGFLEKGETIEEGAMRETREEANAEVVIGRLFSVYSIPDFAQVYMFFLAELPKTDFSPGAETEAVALFSEPEIPWKEIAFSSVRFTLKQYFDNRSLQQTVVHVGRHGIVNDAGSSGKLVSAGAHSKKLG